ncbi:hypothetical protein SLEP1_g24669 [Rubroshorea leprosula]|uniref:AAA+ ATPase domain-containing protein n=1 Tax=Rubroshorea leprosula TaxID=152421 RepID=A0AAV5JQT9_9ROSI|nr:hypothetical protein SLEP1_g24669 [Rubroshorea leprosula]
MFADKDQSNVIKVLRKQIADLEVEKESVKRYTEDFPNSKTEELKKWSKKTSELIEKAHDLVEDVGKRGKSLFQLRKKAEQICKDIAAHVQEARGFSDFPLSYRQEKVAADRFEDFESRSGVLKDIMEALRSPGINKIGVYGKPGMGKTMMVREVKRRAEQERLFDAVLVATVGRNPDLPRIQDEIARVSNEQTGLIEKKVLVILDDLWEPGLSLELLGINGKEGNNVVSYKLLLTSRARDVVSLLSETQFEIDILRWEEAWNLFKKTADDPGKSRGLPFYAEEITKKCKELPIAVATLANALRRRNLIEWKTTLRKLQSLPFDQLNSSQIPQSLYSAIELHCSGLKSNELQQIFLLCSLLGRNATIQNLLKYGIGLGLFPGVKSIEEARTQLLNSVTKLTDSSLLLDSGSSLYFDMHNLVRDFATSTVSKEYGVLALTEHAPINRSHMEAMESIKWIYLSNGDTSLLPDELKCPKLTFFHFSEKNPSLASPPNLFRDKEGLKVLSLSKVNFLSIPSLISPPKNLCTLCLDQVELGTASIGTMMGELENLQVLSLAGSDIKELPKQIGQLTNLKLLDLSDCTELKVIPPGVLSNLSGLEELYMRNSFVQWAEGIEEHENQNASLAELQPLLLLTSIELHVICNIQKIPGGLFSENLARFKVFLGDRWNHWSSSWGVSKLLKLKPDARISSHHSVRKLLKKTNELHLEGLIGVKNVVNELDNDGFQELKCLFVQDALEIQHIISVKPAFPVLEVLVLRNLENMEKICHGPLEAASFRKLRLITIECCNKLKNLFSASIARQLQQLQEIRVKHCSDMEEIIDDKEQESWNSAEEREGHIVELITLRSLKLQRLPKLISFNGSCRNMTFFNEKVVFSNLEELQLFSIMIDNTIWHNSMTSCIKKLTKLIIHGCDNLEYLFSFSMATGLWKLRHLQVKKCRRMRQIIVANNYKEKKILIFPQLTFLVIEDLQNLSSFCERYCIVEFSSLIQLRILNCINFGRFIKFFARTNVAYDTPSSLGEKVVSTSELEELQLCSIERITTIWDISIISCFEKLTKLIIHHCKNLKYLLSPSDASDSEGMIQLLLPKLKRLEFGDLPQYHSFPSKLVEGRIKRLELTDIDVENTWVPPSVQELVLNGCNYLRSLNDISSTKDAEELKCCRIRDCNGVKCVFSSSINLLAQKLEALDLFSLENLEALFEAEASTKSPIPPDTFSSLKTISVRHCHKIKTLFPFWMNLQSLEEINIGYCNQMEEIIVWDAEGGGKKEGVILPKLKSLKLKELPALKSICSRRAVMVCDSLEEIQIVNCQGLRRIPLYLPLLDNGQPSPPPFLKQINVWPQKWGESWWESLEWDHPDAKAVLLRFRNFDW